MTYAELPKPGTIIHPANCHSAHQVRALLYEAKYRKAAEKDRRDLAEAKRKFRRITT